MRMMKTVRESQREVPEVTAAAAPCVNGPIGDGDLVRCQAFKTTADVDSHPSYHYGIVLRTTFPMRDNPTWSDHLIHWTEPVMHSRDWWWCGHIELVSRGEKT